MSKSRSLIVLLIIISLIFCADGGNLIAAADTISATSVYGAVDNSKDVINFKDMYLKILIRQKINKPTGKIFKSDVAKITELNLANQDLNDISDLKNFPNLTVLYLEDNKISDLTPLTGLKKLTKLKLSENKISKIAPLAGLTKLTSLYLDNNQISDFSVLSKLTALKCLYLKSNKTTNYSAVTAYYKNLKEKDFTISVAPPKPAIKVSYNGKAIALDGAPSVISGKTMVSLKPLLTALGYKYTYTAKTKTISAVKGKLKLALKLDSADGTFNGKKIKLDYPVRPVKTMQYAPVKSLCEKLGYKVISSTTYVSIRSK